MSGSSNGISDSDRVALTFLGLLGLPTLLAFAGIWWGNGVRWLVTHQVLVGADDHPLLPIPGLAGAGLDLPRATIAAAVVVTAIVVAISAARRALVRRRRQAMGA